MKVMSMLTVSIVLFSANRLMLRYSLHINTHRQSDRGI